LVAARGIIRLPQLKPTPSDADRIAAGAGRFVATIPHAA